MDYGSTGSSSPYEAEALALVDRHFANEGSNRLDLVVADYHEEVLWAAPNRNLYARGKDAVKAIYSTMFPNMGDGQFVNVFRNYIPRHMPDSSEVLDEGYVFDYSVARFTLTGGGFLDLPVGTRVEMELLHTFEINYGKICTEIVHEKWRPL